MGDSIPGAVGTDPPPAGITVASPGPPSAGFCYPGLAGEERAVAALAAAHVEGWPRCLTWGDFTELASRPPGETEDAQIHTETAGPDEATVERVGNGMRVRDLTLALTVISTDTWVVGSQRTDRLLNHEQGHFDITGLVARDMARQILRARAQSLNELQRQVRRLIARYNNLADRLTNQYDRQTDHGRNQASQRKWNDQIQQAIRSGRPLASP